MMACLGEHEMSCAQPCGTGLPTGAAAPRLRSMTTVVVGSAPPPLRDWLDERRRLGLDVRDERWEGVLHVAPYAGSAHGRLEAQLDFLLYPRARAAGLVAGGRFNLGDAADYRIPDGGYHHDISGATYVETAAVVVEILSADDESYAKLPFYAARGVDEVIMVDPADRSVRCWRLAGVSYVEQPASEVLDVSTTALADELDWP